MIAIDQDKLGVQCRRIKNGLVDILVKPLENSKVAVCAFNKFSGVKNVSVDLNKIANLGFVNLNRKNEYDVLDVWENESFVSGGTVNASVAPHGVKVYIVG